jgi:ribosomal protein S18 acetylase RimI-like enzyme
MASLFENEKEALTAMNSGADFIQGFYLAKPQNFQQLDSNLAKTSLNNSLFHVIVSDKSQLIGMGRVVGDGAMYFYIQDVIVDPSYQHYGVGSVLMEQIENYLFVAAKKGSTIGLLAAKGKEAFYTRYGYIPVPPQDAVSELS